MNNNPKAAAKLAEIQANVRRLAAATPDFKYTRALPPTKAESKPHIGACRYEPTPGNPQGCIVGAASREAGISLDYLSGIVTLVLSRKLDLGLGDYYPVLSWLRWCQSYQDDGMSWSAAVFMADTNAAGTPSR